MKLRNFLIYSAALFGVFAFIHGCSEAKNGQANADSPYAKCSGQSINAANSWFKRCELFGRTCIVGESGGIWCD